MNWPIISSPWFWSWWNFYTWLKLIFNVVNVWFCILVCVICWFDVLIEWKFWKSSVRIYFVIKNLNFFVIEFFVVRITPFCKIKPTILWAASPTLVELELFVVRFCTVPLNSLTAEWASDLPKHKINILYHGLQVN